MQGTLVPELDELLSLGVGLFSLALLAVTLIAYRKNRQRRLLFVSGAFGLFAAKTLVRHLDILIFNWGSATTEFLYSLVDFAILLLFFLAISIKN